MHEYIQIAFTSCYMLPGNKEPLQHIYFWWCTTSSSDIPFLFFTYIFIRAAPTACVNISCSVKIRKSQSKLIPTASPSSSLLHLPRYCAPFARHLCRAVPTRNRLALRLSRALSGHAALAWTPVIPLPRAFPLPHDLQDFFLLADVFVSRNSSLVSLLLPTFYGWTNNLVVLAAGSLHAWTRKLTK